MRTRGCLGGWEHANVFPEKEKDLGPKDSVEACVQAVKKECPEYDIANVGIEYLPPRPNTPVDACYCQNL
jgi:hypothetical protein